MHVVYLSIGKRTKELDYDSVVLYNYWPIRKNDMHSILGRILKNIKKRENTKHIIYPH